MTKKVAVVQSNYIPWKGYFDLIASVDEFILFDDMQFTRRDWRNRNRIKTPDGLKWLTVPVSTKGKYHQLIRETEIDGDDWATKHWLSLELNYRRAPHFDEIATWLKPLYLDSGHVNLSALNRLFIESINHYLGIDTVISNSWDYRLVDGKTERLISLCEQAGGSEYVSGSMAKDYLDADKFDQRDIRLTWFNYSGYPEYPQQWGEFAHHVSILDLLFNCGSEARNYMRRTH